MSKVSKTPKVVPDSITAEQIAAIPDSVIKLISRVAADRTIEHFNKTREEYRKNEKEYRLHNTRYLLKKYRWLKTFAGNAVSDLTQLLEEEDVLFLEHMGLETYELKQVGAIKDRVVYTNTVLGHIDTMLDMYKQKCLSSPKDEIRRRWNVLYGMYLSEEIKTAETIAEEECISDRMIYRDLNAAIDDLTGLFFGLDLSGLTIM